MEFFWTLLSYAGGTAVLIGAAAWLARLLVQHRLAKDFEDYKRELDRETEIHRFTLQQGIETHKAELARANAQALDAAKFEFEKELIVRRGEIDFMRDAIRFENETDQQRQTRLHAQIQRWANPILSAINDLEHRLENILQQGGHVVLAVKSQRAASASRWSADYDYFMASTVYYFAQYFCWVRLMQQQLGHELFRSSREMEAFLQKIEDVSHHLSAYPYSDAGDTASDGVDRQVFRLQQRAMGELLLDRSGAGEQILGYRSFLDQWFDADNQKLKRHLAPMEAFLKDIEPTGDLRWARLSAMREELRRFRAICKSVLNPG